VKKTPLRTLNFITEDEKTNEHILPVVKFISEMALRLDKLFPDQEIKTLRGNKSDYITYTSEQLACLVGKRFKIIK
jgi:hypothetical protein